MLISIGSNESADIINVTLTVQKSRLALEDFFQCAVEMSRLFQTPAFPKGSGPDFVNAVCGVDSAMSAEDVLAGLHRIEANFGRVRATRWGQRTLDLDLLAAGHRVAPDLPTWTRWRDLPLDRQMQDAPDKLILPHPRLQDRGFVLVPLADIAPDWVHPVTQLTATEMRDALDPADLADIIPLS